MEDITIVGVLTSLGEMIASLSALDVGFGGP
jgi:hypothetical protein